MPEQTLTGLLCWRIFNFLLSLLPFPVHGFCSLPQSITCHCQWVLVFSISSGPRAWPVVGSRPWKQTLGLCLGSRVQKFTVNRALGERVMSSFYIFSPTNITRLYRPTHFLAVVELCFLVEDAQSKRLGVSSTGCAEFTRLCTRFILTMTRFLSLIGRRLFLSESGWRTEHLLFSESEDWSVWRGGRSPALSETPAAGRNVLLAVGVPLAAEFSPSARVPFRDAASSRSWALHQPE